MEFWKQIQNELEHKHAVVLMYVIESQGSSPGRQGFKMMVSQSGRLAGSIGGGFMEHKLVELCRQELLNKPFDPFIKRQIHRASVPENKSGMICSGEQTIAFYKIGDAYNLLINEVVQSIEKSEFGVLQLNGNGLYFQSNTKQSSQFILTIESENAWNIKEDIVFKPELHIVGGGHVSLALSKIAKLLDFRIFIYDDRQGLNTMDQNQYGQTIVVDSYENIRRFISDGENKYVVLMSFGFRTDKVVLKQLLDHRFKYLGMMGSKEKVKQLFEELEEEGISKDQLNKVHSPIGVQIKSETPEEIAISILAELIMVKNSQLK